MFPYSFLYFWIWTHVWWRLFPENGKSCEYALKHTRMLIHCHHGIKLVCSLVMNLASESQVWRADARTCWCESKSNPRRSISNGYFLHKLQTISRHRESQKSNLASTFDRTSCKCNNSWLHHLFLLISPPCHPFIQIQQTCLVLCLNYYGVRRNQT
jgi:hypothetical protein